MNSAIEISPYCQAQGEFLRDKHRYSQCITGVGGGKTFIGAWKSLLMITENPGIKICVTAPTYKVLWDATIPTYREVFSSIPIEGFAHFVGGDSPAARIQDYNAEVIFRSTDKPDSLVGMQIGGCHMDENARSGYDAFQVLCARLRQQNKSNGGFYPCQLWGTTTPKGVSNWIYHEFLVDDNRPDYQHYWWDARTNPYLEEGYHARLGYTGKLFDQEVLGRSLNLEGESLFSIEGLDARTKEITNHQPVEIHNNGLVRIWKPPVFGIKYVGGADCSDKGGGGYNCLVILEQQTGDECLEIHGDISSDQFASLCNEWGRKYNNCLLGIECNGTVGGWTTKALVDMGYPKLYKSDKDRYGWYTSTNRPILLEAYKVAVDSRQTVIHSTEAIMEMRTFISKGDRYEHMDRCYDDRVMARAIAWRMVQERQGIGMGFRSWKRPGCTY